ncbi:hypothetical protein QFC21_001815 [Naganishia friedmannii]|uniref:Uncharacterized protein n=1 Tax=Naganishia friedmannii TaxID=89922 RepID=A0ACC2W133_9TREE|nr:hypothetical protein QFC21_001815 [Naganishia friedmannii]
MPSQQPQYVDRVSTSAALSQHGHNGNSGNVAGSGGDNPLLDLLSSEREYVERLMSIVRKVAGAWSRANFPPPLLDRMFRSIEGIYKISKALVEKLDDLGANPSTPKALGDLLMQWVEDLIGPYTRYASIYLSGYDHFSSVANNQRLPGILAAISQALPPVPPLGTWTLDALFRLPYLRLRYYRRLYSKLLASATEGRSDYNMLKVAGDKLNTIVSAVEERLDMDVNQVEVHGEDAVLSRVKDLRAGSATAQQDRRVGRVPLSTQDQRPHKSSSPSVDRGASKKLEEERRSVAKWEQQKRGDGSLVDKQADRQAGTSVTSTEFEIKPSSPSSRTTITPVERPENSPLTDLEIRLDTAKAVDLFTMQLKRMSVTEKAEKAKEVWANYPNRVGDRGPLPEMWLLYPPLAGRHLSVLSGGVETELIVTVMKRETFLLKFDDRQSREDTLTALQDCIDFASSVVRPGTSRSANNSPRLDGSMINDNGQNDRRYTQQEVAQDEMSYHRAVEGNITRTAQSMLTAPIRSTSYSPQPMHGPPAAYRSPPTHPSQPLCPSQPYHNGALLPRTASAPVSDSRYYNDDAASRSTVLRHAQPPYQAYTETLPHLQPHRSQSADVYGVTGRDGSVIAGRPHIPSTETPHRMREIFNEADSPVDDTQQARAGPAVVAARLKCKVFLKHGHQQWKPLGPARLQLYIQQGTNIKQLVVEADTREKTMLISTIVLTDGVERVAKTGVAVEISDGQGKRAGLIYMLKCEDEESAGELFSRLISGSDRARSLSVSRK